MADTQRPVLSVVVAIVSDTTERADTVHLKACLSALRQQTDTPLTEIIVPYHRTLAGVQEMEREYPGVRFIEISDLRTYTGKSGSREHHDELRARGLLQAQGEIIALIEDHGAPAQDWSARIIEAHQQPFAAIGGAIENGIDLPLNWGVYFCDFLRYQNPISEGVCARASDANIAYKREALESVRPVWHSIFHEESVNRALQERGQQIGLTPAVMLYQRRQGLRLKTALQERFVWGRSYAAMRNKSATRGKRMLWLIFSPILPGLILARMLRMAFRKRRTFLVFLKVLPITAALTVAWSWGEFAGYLSDGGLREAEIAGSHATL